MDYCKKKGERSVQSTMVCTIIIIEQRGWAVQSCSLCVFVSMRLRYVWEGQRSQ